MNANELRIAGPLEIPDATVDEVIDVALRVRVVGLERDQLDVTGYGDTEPKAIDGGLLVRAVAVMKWPTPAEVDPAQTAIPPEYWETAQ